MDLPQIVILALIQGLTEFLPISSSAHLILAPHFLGYADQGLVFDVAVHIGTLAAVMIYFRREIAAISHDSIASIHTKSVRTDNTRLGGMILLATLPIILFGLIFKDTVETGLRSPLVIAGTTVGFGILLWIFDVRGKRERNEFSIDWKDALVIGLFQAMAIVPGTSRSGSTITAGLMLGLTRQAASRFSFLLSIPTILMSGGLIILDLVQAKTSINWSPLLIGSCLSFAVAYFTIHYFLKFIETVSMLPFVLYRLLLGTVLFALVLLGSI